MRALPWPIRALLGFVAGVIATLSFHQAMWAVLHGFGLMPPAYPMVPTKPWGVPKMVSMCFWAGVWGAAFGLLLPRLRPPLWRAGLGLGVTAALVGLFVVLPLKGLPVAAGLRWKPWVDSLLINGCWGLGVGLIVPLLMPRAARAEVR